MPARKPGGKYKGKIGRAKGEATIAAELEARRRRAYEENLRRLQERRAQDLLAEQGLQSAEDEAMELKLQRLAQMFGQSKKGTVKKFFKNWKVGLVAQKRENALRERQTCWRRSCAYCTMDNVPGKFGDAHRQTCKQWWKSAMGLEGVGEELHPHAAAKERHPEVNAYRQCTCCNCDTGVPGLGCRAWEQLTDSCFESIFKQEQREYSRVQFAQDSLGLASGRSASTPSLGRVSPRYGNSMTESAYENMHFLRSQQPVPEYDPTMPYVLTAEQEDAEERKRWISNLQNTAGSAERRLGMAPGSRSGYGTLGTLPPLTDMTLAPKLTAKGKPLEQVPHWRTGQKTMLDRHMMKMYVVGARE